MDFDTYVLAYRDNGNDGVIKTFDFATMAATITPRISAVSIAADHSTIAVTFNEPVFNATGGSGSLQANDFSLSFLRFFDFLDFWGPQARRPARWGARPGPVGRNAHAQRPSA